MRAVITVANPLKAAGRTAAVAHLGTELALRGYRTLLIDLDPQADLTAHFVSPDLDAVRRHNTYFPPGTGTLADVLVGDTAPVALTLSAILLATPVPRLWLAPSTVHLGLFNTADPLAMARLAGRLECLRGSFDFVLVDTPRSQTRLLEAALFASTHLLVSAAPCWDVEGATGMTVNLMEEMRRFNRYLRLLGIFRNRVDPYDEEAARYAELRAMYGEAVCDCAVYVCGHTELCRERHLPVQLTALDSRGAESYVRLADELLDRLGIGRSKNKEGRRMLRAVEPVSGEGRAGSAGTVSPV